MSPFSSIFQRTVTCPVKLLELPDGCSNQLHVPMDVHDCEIWCEIFCPDRCSGLHLGGQPWDDWDEGGKLGVGRCLEAISEAL